MALTRGADTTPAHGVSTEAVDRAAAIAALLRHYDRLLLAADHAPPVIWVRARPHRGGRWDVWRLPRPTLLLRFFVRLHVRRGVQALRRRLSAERALARGGSALADEHDAVVRYEDAIPPLHGRAIAVALAAAVLIIGRLAVQYAGQLLSSVPALTHVQRGDIRSGSSVERPIAFSGQAEQLMRRLGESVADGIPSPSKIVDVVLSARLGDIAVVLGSASFALYVALRPCVPGFRLKRMLVNVAADAEALNASTARWHVTRSTGVYTAEQRIFERLRTRPPRELPVDLLVSALLCVVPFALGTYLLTRAQWDVVWRGWVVADLTVAIALLLILLACVRIAWLVGAGRHRLRGDAVPRPPYDVRLPSGRHAVVRNPLAVALTVYFLPQAFLLWLAGITWELASLLRPGARPRRTSPTPARLQRVHWVGAAVVAIASGLLLLQLPVATVGFLVPSSVTQVWPPGSWWPSWLYWTILAVTAPPVAALGQAAVNGLWKRIGTRVPEGPEERADSKPSSDIPQKLE